jgi:hypothetical protein
MKTLTLTFLLLSTLCFAQKKVTRNYSYLRPAYDDIVSEIYSVQLNGLTAFIQPPEKISCKDEAKIFLDSVKNVTDKETMLLKKYSNYIIEYVKSIILPSLSNFEPLLKIQDLKYFELNVGYTVRDFGDKDSGSKGEQVSIIVSREVIVNYINSKITDKEVMAKSLFYNKNKDSDIVKLITF